MIRPIHFLCALLAPAALALPSFSAAQTTTAGQEFLTVLSLNADAANGSELFKQCAECHGENGGGLADGTAPRIAGQHRAVLVRQLLDFRHGLRWNESMERVTTSLHGLADLQDLADVANYVSNLERQEKRGIGDGAWARRGERVYAARCIGCHGRDGEGGNARPVPRLAGQHYPYLLRQMYDALDGRRPQLGLSHRKYLKPLGPEELVGLADYLSRVGWHSESPGGE